MGPAKSPTSVHSKSLRGFLFHSAILVNALLGQGRWPPYCSFHCVRRQFLLTKWVDVNSMPTYEYSYTHPWLCAWIREIRRTHRHYCCRRCHCPAPLQRAIRPRRYRERGSYQPFLSCRPRTMRILPTPGRQPLCSPHIAGIRPSLQRPYCCVSNQTHRVSIR